MNFLHENYSNLDLTPDHAHLIHTQTQQYQVHVAQITEPCPPSPRSRTGNKIGGAGNEHPFMVHPLKRVKWI